MPETFTSNLGITLPADGENDGTWGAVVNENMQILDRAINGSVTLTLSGTTSTLTTAEGELSLGQYMLLVLGGTPSGTHTITILPNDAQKVYLVRNTTAQSVVFTQGSGGNVTIAAGTTAIISSDGGGAGAAVVNISNSFSFGAVSITGGTINNTAIGGTTPAAGNFTTVDATALEVTTLRAKDGTAAGSIADSTGVVTLASSVLTTTDINGGTIDGTVIGGSSAAAGNFTTVDATALEVTTLRAKDGTAAGSIADSTGVVTLASSVLTTADINGGTIDGAVIGGSSAAAGTFTTVNATTVNATTVDAAALEVTTLRAKDGTAAGSIADSTGVVTLASSVLTTADINGGTIDGAVIGGSFAAAGNFTTANATSLEATFLRAKNGTAAGSIADSTGVVSLTSSVLTTVDINGGTIDGTTIGGSVRAAINGTTGDFNSTLTVAPSSGAGIVNILPSAGTSSSQLRLHVNSSGTAYQQISVDGGVLTVGTLNANPLYLKTNDIQRIGIAQSGEVSIGTTDTGNTPNTGVNITSPTSATRLNIGHASGTSSGTAYVGFSFATTAIGSITQNGTTAVLYNTTSDYRLKENVRPMTGALAKVAQLNPVTYTWKADGSAGQGFIAHELQAVAPDAVSGTKDAVDADGNPQYQGVDTSMLVATLVKALQELAARVAELEAK
jgi:hypothetical protein